MWPMVGKLEMLDLPWFNVDEEIQRLRETGMLEWICHVRPTHSPWECPEETQFTITERNKFLRGALASLNSSVIALLCRPDLTVGITGTDLGNLNALEVTRPHDVRGQTEALKCQR